jgi:predicted RecB family nuclease
VLLDAGVVSRCRRRVHLEHDTDADRSSRRAPDPGAEQRTADAAVHRRTVADELARRVPEGWAEVPAYLPAGDRARHTESLLAAGAPFIWGGLLPVDPSGGRRGGMDLLVRTGDGYVPVLVVRHKVTDPGSGARTTPLFDLAPHAARRDPLRKVRAQPRDQLRLAHAVRLLQAAGIAAPGRATGGVVGLEADVVLWHDLDARSWPGGRSAMAEYDSRFADRIAVATAAATGADPLALPSRVTECRSCPWWPTCEAAMRSARDVSLVLRGEDAMALRAVGVRTVDDLAALDVTADPPAPLAGTAFPDAVLLARAWQRDLSLVRRHSAITVPRADVEVDVDMESFGDAGAYLWGCLLTGADIGVRPGYHAFATWEPVPTADEGRSFARRGTGTSRRAGSEFPGVLLQRTGREPLDAALGRAVRRHPGGADNRRGTRVHRLDPVGGSLRRDQRGVPLRAGQGAQDHRAHRRVLLARPVGQRRELDALVPGRGRHGRRRARRHPARAAADLQRRRRPRHLHSAALDELRRSAAGALRRGPHPAILTGRQNFEEATEQPQRR